MKLEELKEKLRSLDLGVIKPSNHGFKMVQDEKRAISYPLVIKHLLNPDTIYKFEEQKARYEQEIKLKLFSKINYLYDLVIIIVGT